MALWSYTESGMFFILPHNSINQLTNQSTFIHSSFIHSREVHEKGEKDRHPMNAQLLPMDSQTTRPSGSANFAEAAEYKDPLVLPSENTGGCEIKLQSLDKAASLSHNSSASSTGPTYSQHSTEGHESEDERFPESESDSDREGQ